jgi:CubicO group peptidase (beta-lactamase class C family)
VPGVKSSYSNTEYIILHKIIELASGRSYSEFLNEVIIKPLKLKNTGVNSYEKVPKRMVKAYTFSDSLKTLTPDEPYYGEMYFGAGNMYATCNDLLVFDQAIFSNKQLNKHSTQKLLEIHDDLGYTSYGFWGSTGWGNFNEKFYYRTGGILGSTSNWIHTMGTNKTIIVLSNTDATNLYELSEKIYLLQ